MIAWGRLIGCREAGHGFEPGGRGVYTRLLVDDGDPRQHSFLMASREDWKSQFATSKLERYAKMGVRTSWRRFDFPSVPALARAIRL